MSESSHGPVRIAVWSGPRNISTALMRSWDARSDTSVVDEPFYAHYLLATGLDHPGREAVIAAQENDWRAVSGELTAGPCATALQYQKQMAHHLLPEMCGDWVLALRNVMLVRDPAAMLLSLSRVLAAPQVADTGLGQQVALARWLTETTGEPPPLIDSKVILQHPATGLDALCRAVGVAFDPAMLSWRAGPRDTDGIWAPYWYASVQASTGFEPYHAPDAEVPAELRGVLDECQELHAELLSLCHPVG